jgi:hypothetical protein
VCLVSADIVASVSNVLIAFVNDDTDSPGRNFLSKNSSNNNSRGLSHIFINSAKMSLIVV